jgi:PRTRC genetic system ThiF family protein
VTLIDGDRISPTNCVRQPFAEGEIGLFKAVVLMNRLNLFWGLDWDAVPRHLTGSADLPEPPGILIGCVDSRTARATIARIVTDTSSATGYCMDIGNSADSGQFVLGHP